MSPVWRGVVVEENNIQVHISAMRKAPQPSWRRAKAMWSRCRVAGTG